MQRANSFLAAVAARVQPGEILEASPAEVGAQAGLTEPLTAARAVRALLARRRLESADGKYRLLDPRPVEPGEPESIPRRPRKKKAAGRGAASGRPTYADVGHVAIDRLVEMSREVGNLRATARAAKDETRAARQSKDDAERRAHSLQARVHDLEAKLDMAEQNLRTLLAAARGGGREEALGNTEMEAILGILKGNGA